MHFIIRIDLSSDTAFNPGNIFSNEKVWEFKELIMECVVDAGYLVKKLWLLEDVERSCCGEVGGVPDM